MLDNAWSTLTEPWERLRWSRLRWQANTGQPQSIRAAAASLGIKEGTYATYERSPDSAKNSAFSLEQARLFARKYKVSWVWLLTGEGSPFDNERPYSPEAASAAQLIDAAPERERKAIVEALRTLLRAG